MATTKRPPLVPAVLAGAALLLLWAAFRGSSAPAPAAPSSRLLQSLAEEAQLRPARQAHSLVGGPGGEPEWGPRATPGSSHRGGHYVITSVMGLDPERLNIFVGSLRRHSPSTQLVVFVEEATDGSLLRDNGAEVIPFKMPTDSALVLHRFELYKKYLIELEKRDSEAGVILTDSRDVLIQSDPWKHPLVQQLVDEDSMLFSLEGGLAVGEVPMRAQPQNEHWIDVCFGQDTVAALAEAPISCAGITIGSVAAVTAYVTQLLDVAYQTATPKCRKYGSDQAVHNYMLHHLGPRGQLKYAYHVRRNWESPVHTAGYGWPITIDQEGTYRRVNGSFVPPIVHQYDRAFEATKIYLAMYPLRPAEVRWDGPDCVKNLFLDTVTQCPEEGASKSGSSSSSGKKDAGSKTDSSTTKKDDSGSGSSGKDKKASPASTSTKKGGSGGGDAHADER